MMLNVHDLTAAYGEIVACRDINLFVKPGEMVALIGANGAGKTSLLRAINGVLKPCKGKIIFNEKEIHHLPVHKIVQMGIAWVQEGRATFKRITVEENLKIGAYNHKKQAMLADMDAIYMRFPILKDRCKQVAGTLSGGQQQILAIARALMSRPRLIILDEPSLGVAPIIVSEIYRVIESLQRDGITILLVEQNAALALKASQRAYVMESGRIMMQGLSKELANDPCIQHAYLGAHPKQAKS